MKNISVTVYEFNELSDEAKQKAIKSHQYINFDFGDWWEGIYEDAHNGVEFYINSFSTDRANYCKGHFKISAIRSAQLIAEYFGATDKLTPIAKQFIENYNKIDTESIGADEERDQIEKLENEFLNEVQEYYLQRLKNEETYLFSDEAIIQTFEANEYLFYDNGTRAEIPNI